VSGLGDLTVDDVKAARAIVARNVDLTLDYLTGAWMHAHGALDIVAPAEDANYVYFWAAKEWPDQLAVYHQWVNEKNSLDALLAELVAEREDDAA
jgi:hypothetical protein